MLSHRYEVQYTLYILAVHRLLKSRLKDYNYEQHMGGAMYLYLRGIDQVGQGVYAHKPPFALIQALDEAFQSNQHVSSQGVLA
jgi:exodeoxyribonuclease V beta subunit